MKSISIPRTRIKGLLAAFTIILGLTAMELFLMSCTRGPSAADIQARIHRIENSLVPVTSLAEAFQPESTRLSDKMNLQARMAQLGVPGLSMTVINNSAIEWSRGYGVLRSDAPDTVTTATLFEAASVTKQFTAVMILRAVEQGLLSLDTPVNTRLKSWLIPDNEFTQQQPVTVYHILTHQAGINRPDGGFGYPDETQPTLLQVLNGEPPAENDPAVVEFVPGTQWMYSNMGYVILQQLLEDVYRQPYAELIRTQLFEPLHMNSSMVDPARPAELDLPFASPHDGEGTAHEHALHVSALGHGALITTPTDLAAFTLEIMRSWQGTSGRILSQAMTRDMLAPKCPVDMFGINGQGLSFFLVTGENTRYFIAMGSNWPGTFCALAANPQSGHGAVIMANAEIAGLICMELLASLAMEYNWPPLTLPASAG